ncbi:MAG: hypothetical protein CME65_13935 [Halobacteriovoraceae bacterium]|nr:hypothetical protein [Halobacteriovoraceae bacterium]
MKKVLIIGLSLPLLAGILFFVNRYQNNRATVIPYPFIFPPSQEKIELEAPILIIGDRMAARLDTFKDQLAKKISNNISGQIKIQTLAGEGQNIHRSLKKLKSLERLPLVIIFLSNTDENYESLFAPRNYQQIVNNLDLYQDINLQSLLMLFPWLSKLVYSPVNYKELGPTIKPRQTAVPERLVYKHNEILFRLYEASFGEILQYAKKSTSYVIPVTTPINLSIPPKSACYGSIDRSYFEEFKEAKALFSKSDFKGAFNITKELALLNPYSAEILYLHSRILYKLNEFSKAHDYGELAVSYDCGRTGANPILNEIMKKTAQKYNFPTFDYHTYLADESTRNSVFIDDIYPQDYYLGKLTDILALKIQKLLKLE